jgi:hypothetical protein
MKVFRLIPTTLILMCFWLPSQSLHGESSLSLTKTDEPGAVYFTPPEGWRLADQKGLPSSVKVMVVGKGAYEFPPSINLSIEPFDGTQKQYMKIVKSINDSKGTDWKDLGNIKTDAGNANLSQVDSKSEWGEVRMMHVILQKNKKVYIMTAASLKDEFARFYKDFFSAIRSLHINPDKTVKSTKEKSGNNLLEITDTQH